MGGRSERRKWRGNSAVMLAAVLAVAVFGGGLMMSGGSAESAGRKAAARLAVAATKYDRDNYEIFYKMPPRYRAVQQKNGIVMVPQADLDAGQTGGFLLITPSLVLDAGRKAKLKEAGKKVSVQAIAIALGNLAADPRAKLTEPESVNDAARDGYEAYTVASQSKDQDAGGAMRYTQYLIILSKDRVHVIMRVAYNSEVRFNALLPGFNALAVSIEPKNSGAPPPARVAGALPTDVAVITPKVKSALTQRTTTGATRPRNAGGNCQVRYRQQCSYVGAGAFQNYSCLPVPYTPAGCP